MALNIFCSIIRIPYSIGVSIAAGVTALITIPILYEIMLLPQTVLRAVNPLTLLPVQCPYLLKFVDVDLVVNVDVS